MTAPGAVRLWVQVSTPEEVDEMRRLGVCEAFVMRSPERPFYGRPGDMLYVRLSEEDVAGPLQPLSYRIPLRAGVIVPASERGLVALQDLRRRGRQHTAAEVRTLSEFLLVGAAGAEYVLVAGEQATEITRQAAGRPPWVVTEVGSVPEVAEALRVGASAVLVSSGLLRELVAGEAAGAAAAARQAGQVARPAGAVGEAGPAVRDAPAPGLAGQAPARGPSLAPTAREPEPSRPPAAPWPGDTVAGLLEKSAERFGTKPALIHHARGKRLTFHELRDRSRALAKGLLALGVGRGERVALMARNVPEWPVIQFGTAYLGAVLVTVNSSSTADELHYMLTQSGASVLVAQTPEMVEAVSGAQSMGLPDLRTAVALGPGRLPGAVSIEELIGRGRAISDRDLDHAAASLAPEDVINIQYTSGTTGFAKGARLTHRGMLLNARAVGANLRLSPGDRLCLPVPFFHCFGCVLGTLTAVTFGSALVVPADWFDPVKTLEALQAERCTVLYGVPTMFQAELAALRQRKDSPSTLRTGIVAGAPVSAALMRDISAEMHIPALTIAYGLTEASPVVTQTPMDAPPEVRFGTIGVPLPGAEVKLVDPQSGERVSIDTPGELCTRGPMVMQGYFGMPQESAEAIDPDGWLHTGDLASVDASGRYRIVGRLKEMIIRGGENIYPAEVESVLERHPAIRQAAVVGIPSEYYGEEVEAWVIPQQGRVVDEQELREFVRRHLAPFKVPSEIRVVQDLPVTGSGKVRKLELRGAGRPAGPTRSQRRLALPLLRPKGRVGQEPEGEHRRPTAGPSAHSHRGDAPAPGWSRPEMPGWTWTPGLEAGPAPDGEEGKLDTDIRRRGTRIKKWEIGGDIEQAIEATGEYPVMYRALGTAPQTSHPFNLYHDIRIQPEALAETFQHADEVVRVAQEMARRELWGVLGIGSGTSQFVAQVIASALARFAGLPAWDADSLAYRQYRPPYDFKKLAVIAYSGSGSTVDTVAAARDAREAGAFTVAFTSVDDSPIVKATDMRVLTAGGFDTGGSDTFHYTTRLAAGILLALELGRRRQPDAHPYDALTGELFATAERMAEVFERTDVRCQSIARSFYGVRSILIVGGGPNFGTAEEIALKFDEMAHIPAKGMSPGRHIHGALGLTDENILTILVAPPGVCYDELESIAEVTKILKTPSVAIVSENDDRIAKMVDYVIRLPIEDETLFSVLAILPGQLIPYWCGVQLGLNPDTQRSNIPKHARVWNMLFPAETH